MTLTKSTESQLKRYVTFVKSSCHAFYQELEAKQKQAEAAEAARKAAEVKECSSSIDHFIF